MKRLLPALVSALICIAFCGAAADAKPNVILKLSGALVQRDADGKEKLVPVERAAPRPGDLIRFIIVAQNDGTDAASHLVPVDRIPAGTKYEPGSASANNGARAEFSLDGGKTWSAAPTVVVRTPSGEVVKKADPATYTMVRWIAERPLAPKSSFAYAYTVRVK